MKKLVLLTTAAVMLTACDGDMAKRVARAVLNEDQPQQVQQEAQPAQTQLQPVQQVTAGSADVAQQPVQQPTPQPQPTTTVIVQEEQIQEPVQKVVVQKVVKEQAGHHIMTQHDGYVYMRSGPYAEARKIKKLPDYTPVAILSCTGETEYRTDVDSGNIGQWCKVRAAGKVGYVYNSYIQAN